MRQLLLGIKKRAIDGTRTRGLDLGKVARYQLRHYRICCFLQQRYVTTLFRRSKVLFCFFYQIFIPQEKLSGLCRCFCAFFFDGSSNKFI